ncbi:chemotaxis protein CheW [Cohnella yongneupensis]|uniref:Chemotaxis protein CheA n=1 Tax=Cohnella yongneupensis TaxID=425006 RepID=A0ABW0R010_9BACL
MNDSFASAYLSVFLDELEEQLQVLDHSILELEDGGNLPETLQTIFRAAHTLKGSTAAMGFNKMKDVTHKVESVFDLLRNGRLTVNATLIDTLFQCIDYLKSQRELLRQGNYEEQPNDKLIQLLGECLNGPSEAVSEAAPAAAEPAPAAEAASGESFVPNVEPGTVYRLVEVKLAEQADMPIVKAMVVHRNLSELGEIVGVFPSMDDWEEEALLLAGPITYAVVTEHDSEAIVANLLQISQVAEVRIVAGAEVVRLESQPIVAADSEDVLSDAKTAEAGAKPGKDAKVQIQQTVRVDINRLEHLLNLVGELIIDNTRLQDVKRKFGERFKQEPENALLSDVTDHLSRVVSELQDGMMKTRMMPIEQLFNRFPRMVRDLAQQAGKEITLSIEGKETELDRTLIEEISDPIIHILRNSADHGLETPEEREKLGKSRKGNIMLQASHQENAIVIKIADDGRGIDANKIKRKSIQNGYVTQEEADRMSDKELIALIFRSGVSTAEQVTELSGRGVGMDIVRAHIEKLNGIVDIDTSLGEGTVFTIKLPLTLAITRSLLVELGKHRFAIPLVNVLETFRLSSGDIQNVHGREVCVVRGSILPLVRMHRAFGTTENGAGDRGYAVMIGIADKRVCLYVDRLIANQEIVMKSLGTYLGQVPYVSGSTIMGDGSIALILDVNAVIREAGTIVAQSRETEDKHIASLNKLVMFQLEQEHYALDIGRVKEIIKVPSILRVANAPREVLGLINLRGSLLPVMDVRPCLGLPQAVHNEASRILIMNEAGRDVGVLVDEVTEVFNIHANAIEPAPDHIANVSQHYIRGICKQKDRLVILLKMDELIGKYELEALHA